MKQCLLFAAIFFAGAVNAQCTADFYYSTTGALTLNFNSGLSSGVDNTTTYAWTFGDGANATMANPSHTYSGFGTYVVCLTINTVDEHCTNEYCDTIVLSCPIITDTFTYLNGSHYEYDFTAQASSLDPLSYSWNFGDGDSSIERDPEHTYAHTGIYDVCLKVTDETYHCTEVTCVQISVCTAQADFSYTNPSGDTYDFTNSSANTDASTTYYWNFDDGDTSALKSPDHTFQSPGDYNVCLTIDVHDSNCVDQHCTMILAGCDDTAKFSYTNTGGLTYSFQDLSVGEDSSVTYTWSFGDGASSGEQNPSHNYTQTGNMEVCLTIDNVDDSCTNTKCTDLDATCNIEAGFTYSHSDNTYNFTDTSGGEDATVTYTWNFGDGGTSSVQNPMHDFLTSGNYNVCLTITDVDCGCTSNQCEHIAVNAAECPATASFTYTKVVDECYFTNASTGTDASTIYHWNFGDGDTSATTNPEHTFSGPGNYNVCLTVIVVDSNCTSNYCSVVPLGCVDSADFSYINTSGLTYAFTDISTGVNDSTTFSWSFGDGTTSGDPNPTHTYRSTGTVDVCLTIVDTALNCHSTHCIALQIPCNVATAFTYTDSGGVYDFSDATVGEDSSATFSWTFGDGGTSTAQNPTHTFTSSGTFNVCLIVDNVDINCSERHCTEIFINLNGCPDTANFTYTNTGTDYNFTDASVHESSTVSYYWQFGDGDTSILKDPGHTYVVAGDYHVCLAITDTTKGCSNQFCQNIYVVTGIESAAANSENLHLYPNPAKDRVFVEWNGASINEISVYNALGEIVMQHTSIGAAKASFDVTSLSTGIYFVRVSSGGEIGNVRLVIGGK